MTRSSLTRSIPGAATAVRIAREAALSPIVPDRHRAALLARLGAPGLERAWVAPNIRMTRPENVTAADGCFINEGAFFDTGRITLGQNVFVGPRAMFLTGTHALGPSSRRAGEGEHLSITVGRGSWIGAGAIILPGVTIGEGCVIGAGAVVTKDCEPNGVYAGVPAKRIKELEA